jgi:hypothetical protein
VASEEGTAAGGSAKGRGEAVIIVVAMAAIGNESMCVCVCVCVCVCIGTRDPRARKIDGGLPRQRLRWVADKSLVARIH